MSALRAPPTRAQGAGGRPEAGICPWAALGAAEAAVGVPGGLWANLQGPMARVARTPTRGGGSGSIMGRQGGGRGG